MDPMGLAAWALRPTLLFASAYLLNGVLHEVAHALAAFTVGVPAVIFQYRVDVRPEDAAPWQHAVIAGAGVVASALFAAACALGYRRSEGRPGQLPLLYLASLGALIAFGNMMSDAGDIARIEDTLDMPAMVDHVMTALGFVGLVAVLIAAGRELRTWFPPNGSRARGILVFVVLPAIAGTGIAAAVSQPMPEAFTWARLAEGVVWIVAAIAAWNTRLQPCAGRRAEWSLLDVLLVAIAVASVRVLVPGVIVLP